MDVYGPPLPPGFQLPNTENANDINDCEPSTKTAKLIGPQFPEFLSHKEKKCDDEDYNNSKKCIVGPDVSDIQVMNSENKCYGEKQSIIGPVLPAALTKNLDDHGDNEIYGPMPSQDKVDYDIVSMIEKRATNMRDKLHGKGAPTKEVAEREEWMVLPDTSRRNQLGAISRCLAPASKNSSKKVERSHHNKQEDEKTTEELKKYNKSKRGESLLDIHRKKEKEKKKKEKKKSSEAKERKAFDREEMGARYFTKKQVNSVIDKAKYLNSRFAPGKSQFL